MFSFHKPRVYRSGSGCCICRAKSSSSRFTDSKRYEQDFLECFKLDENRTGEICNACVLLVKRWKKLPRGSERNWQHVVDARAGHGSKPISKINKVKKATGKREKLSDRLERAMFIPKHLRENSPEFGHDMQMLECFTVGSESYDSSLNASPIRTEEGCELDDDGEILIRSIRARRAVKHIRNGRAKATPKRKTSSKRGNGVFDGGFWRQERTCCGILLRGLSGEILLDSRFIKPCYCRNHSPALSPSGPEGRMIQILGGMHVPSNMENRRSIDSFMNGFPRHSNGHGEMD